MKTTGLHKSHDWLIERYAEHFSNKLRGIVSECCAEHFRENNSSARIASLAKRNLRGTFFEKYYAEYLVVLRGTISGKRHFSADRAICGRLSCAEHLRGRPHAARITLRAHLRSDENTCATSVHARGDFLE